MGGNPPTPHAMIDDFPSRRPAPPAPHSSVIGPMGVEWHLSSSSAEAVSELSCGPTLADASLGDDAAGNSGLFGRRLHEPL